MAAWRLKKLQRRQHLSLLFTILLLATPFYCRTAQGRRRVHKRFIIHIPYKIKTHHHTHTVFSHIHSGGSKKQTIYKIFGDSHYHGGPIHKGHAQDGDYNNNNNNNNNNNYMLGCDDHKSDMIFNHYDRNDEEQQYYPDDVVDDEFFEDEHDEGDGEWGGGARMY